MDTSKKGKKRSRADDVPDGEVAEEVNTQLKAYKQLEAETACHDHPGHHCHVERDGASTKHHRLDHGQMTLWAKSIVSKAMVIIL